MEANGNNNPANYQTVPVKPKSKRNIIIIVAVIVVVAIVATLLVANAMVQSQPTADISDTNWTIAQDISGPTMFNVTVTNSGGAIGSAIIECNVNEPSLMYGPPTNYNSTQVISLNGGDTQTYSIVVNTPFGTTVTSDMCIVNCRTRVNPFHLLSFVRKAVSKMTASMIEMFRETVIKYDEFC